jgi:hypothetical protein
MAKIRTVSKQRPQHSRSEEFHHKLEKGAKTAAIHRQTVQQNEHEAQLTMPDPGHGRSQAAHLTPDEPVRPQTKRPVGDPSAGQHPGALPKR